MPTIRSRGTSANGRMSMKCKPCARRATRRKGDTMPSQGPFDLSAYRPGQHRGHIVTMERLVTRESYTAIVLPCGYGKSGLIRMVSLDGWLRKAISTTLVISPNVSLRNQIVDSDKMRACIERYCVQVPVLKTCASITWPCAGPRMENFSSRSICSWLPITVTTLSGGSSISAINMAVLRHLY